MHAPVVENFVLNIHNLYFSPQIGVLYPQAINITFNDEVASDMEHPLLWMEYPQPRKGG